MKVRLVESREIAPQVRHFVFEVPERAALEFEGGQFFSLSGKVGEATITRAYSAAAPAAGNRFELCLNRVSEGRFSPLLFDLKAGEEVECKGPYGTFTLRRPATDSLFVATGTGIAPFRAILRESLAAHPERQFTLIFGVRHEPGLLYRAEFEALERGHANFRFRPTLSRAGDDWTGRRGHVQAHLDEALGDRRDLTVYACGLKAMVDDVRSILKAKGFDRKQIVYEKYD